MKITLNDAAQILLSKDNVLILTHKSPDGDTIGSAYGLCLALRSLGKKADVVCSDEISPKYEYITLKAPQQDFNPDFIVSVDVADTKLLGEKLSCYSDKINLCIDHHASNVDFAEKSYVESDAAATAQVIEKLLKLMDIKNDKDIANALFTGICTDTGCFRYPNANAETYRIASELIEAGAESGTINRIMFDTKSRVRVEIERLLLDRLEFFNDGTVAFVYISDKMLQNIGAVDSDTEGISAMPRQIEGVEVGITMRDKSSGGFKFSVRTAGNISASEICKAFGGGGHNAAAGCVIDDTLENAKNKIIGVAEKAVESVK